MTILKQNDMTVKYAKDIKINDKFLHNELHPWQAMDDAKVKTKNTVEVLAANTKTMKTKKFEFGNHVQLDIKN